MSTDLASLEAALQVQHDDASAEFNRGVIALVFVPVSVFVGMQVWMWSGSFLAMLIAALYTVCGGCLGVVWFFVGLIKLRRSKRELRELQDSRLPKARLLT